MAQEYFDGIFANASDDFKRANPHLFARSAGAVAELERPPRDGTLGARPVQATTGRRFLVRVTAFRRRLLDEDNLCEKYHVDLCRYARAIPSDAPGTTKIETGQVKVGKGEAERTLIEIYAA